MLNWLNSCLAERAFKRKFQSHYDAAEGSRIQRSAIAAAMTEIEDAWVQDLLTKETPARRVNFTMAYSCMVLWMIRLGMGKRIKSEDASSVIVGIVLHYAKQAWFEEVAFKKIWKEVQFLMPLAFKSQDKGLPFCPICEMLIAADSAGYNAWINGSNDMAFMFHTTMSMLKLTEFISDECRMLECSPVST